MRYTYGPNDTFAVFPRPHRDTTYTCSCRSVHRPYNLISPPPCDDKYYNVTIIF